MHGGPHLPGARRVQTVHSHPALGRRRAGGRVCTHGLTDISTHSAARDWHPAAIGRGCARQRPLAPAAARSISSLWQSGFRPNDARMAPRRRPRLDAQGHACVSGVGQRADGLPRRPPAAACRPPARPSVMRAAVGGGRWLRACLFSPRPKERRAVSGNGWARGQPWSARRHGSWPPRPASPRPSGGAGHSAAGSAQVSLWRRQGDHSAPSV